MSTHSARSKDAIRNWFPAHAERITSNTSVWLPSGNRTICRAAVGDTRPPRRSSLALAPEPLDQRHPAAHPALVPSQQFRHLDLAHAVVLHQRLDDPCFFQSRVRPPTRFSPMDSGFGRSLVSLLLEWSPGMQVAHLSYF